MPDTTVRIPAWADPQNASVLDNWWTRTARTLGGFLGAADPTAQAMAIGAPVELPGGGASPAQTVVRKTLKAFHGSPHDFDQFSLGKIGTGEGGQAYGHGLYFAENPAVAGEYRKVLSSKSADKAVPYGPSKIAFNMLTATPEMTDEALSGALKRLEPGLSNESVATHIQEARQFQQVARGKTYEVNLHASPDELLDWDKPLSESPEKIQQAVLKALNEFIDPQTLTGEEAYQRLVRKSGGRVGHTEGIASQKLKDAGIKGIQYLDQGSRAAGQGTKNFVIFDDKIIEIAKKYGISLPVAASLYKWQQSQQK